VIRNEIVRPAAHSQPELRKNTQQSNCRSTPNDFSRAEGSSMVVAGMLNKQIGAELRSAESAVKVRRSRTRDKMQTASLTELIKMIEKVRAPPEKSRKPKLTNILLFANPEIPTLNRFPFPYRNNVISVGVESVKESNFGC
jgi:hypothetical protein